MEPQTVLDPALMLHRVAETIVVGLSFAKALGYSDEARLGFLFKWGGLKGRSLEPWANPMIYVSSGQEAYDDSVETYIAVPVNTPATAVAPYVDRATKELFLAFDGFRYPPQAIEERVQQLLSRRL